MRSAKEIVRLAFHVVGRDIIPSVSWRDLMDRFVNFLFRASELAVSFNEFYIEIYIILDNLLPQFDEPSDYNLTPEEMIASRFHRLCRSPRSWRALIRYIQVEQAALLARDEPEPDWGVIPLDLSDEEDNRDPFEISTRAALSRILGGRGSPADLAAVNF